MKLNESSPQQHMVILMFGGAIIFMNVLEYVKSSMHDGGQGGPQQRYTQSIDGATGEVTREKTRYENPKLAWYERLLCRGFQRSSNCSFKLLHPKTEDAADLGIAIPDGKPKSDHVVYFEGPIKKNLSLSRDIQSPEAETPPAHIYETEGADESK